MKPETKIMENHFGRKILKNAIMLEDVKPMLFLI
jgi:hypothetical protein